MQQITSSVSSSSGGDNTSSLPPSGRKFSNKFTEIDIDQLTLSDRLGHGAYGIVRKSVWNGRTVAIKLINNEPEKTALANEVEQLSRVNHENVIPLYGVCVQQGNPIGLVMEFAECGSLYDLLHSRRLKYNAGHAMDWALQCAKGVEYLHGMKPHPLVHRDLKPPNLLLQNDGKVLKICDFGTAGDLKTYMTNNKGSAAWMAPEVFEGRKYDQKCDVYSWGIILWEVLTRKRPFEGLFMYAIMWKVHGGARPPQIQNCPKAIEILMIRCWHQDPTIRPPMSEVVKIMTYLSEFFAAESSEALDFSSPEAEEETSALDSFSMRELLNNRPYFGTAFSTSDENGYGTLGKQTNDSGADKTLRGHNKGATGYVPDLDSRGTPVTLRTDVVGVEPVRVELGSPEDLKSSASGTSAPASLRAAASAENLPSTSAQCVLVQEKDMNNDSKLPIGSSKDLSFKKGHRRVTSWDQRLSSNNAVRDGPSSSKLQHMKEPSFDNSDRKDSIFSPPEIPLVYFVLPPDLQPVPPCPCSLESREIFKEHCRIADQLMRMKEELKLLQHQKKGLQEELNNSLESGYTTSRLLQDYEQLQQEKFPTEKSPMTIRKTPLATHLQTALEVHQEMKHVPQ